jgi:hypothetical protein
MAGPVAGSMNRVPKGSNLVTDSASTPMRTPGPLKQRSSGSTFTRNGAGHVHKFD